MDITDHTHSRENEYRRWATAVIVLYLLIGITYSAVTPAWEAHDEWAHYKYVEYIAVQHHLPPQNRRLTTLFKSDEATQPPLYYLLAALPVSLVHPETAYRPELNPYAADGDAGLNLTIHTSAERFPWHGTFLALHLARLVSVLIGALGLFATFHLGRLLWPRFPAVAFLATALQAFSPQYLFITSAVTNDALLAALGGFVIYFAFSALLGQRPFRALLKLFIATSLLLLTKSLALALLPLVIAVTFVVLWRRRPWHTGWPTVKLLSGLVTAVAIMTIVGIWQWRTWQQTGTLFPRDPYAVSTFQRGNLWEILQGLPWHNTPALLVYGFRTYWASFGWGNVDPGWWVTAFFLTLLLAGIAGWSKRCQDGPQRRPKALGWATLAGAGILLLPLLREMAHGTTTLRGRYMLDSLPLVAVWSAAGWKRLWRHPRRIGLLAVLLAGLTLNGYLALGVIRAAYRPPTISPQRAQSYLQNPAWHRIDAHFGNAATLVAYHLPDGRFQPGDIVPVTLLWQIHRRLPHNETLSVKLLGRGERLLGERHRYPGKGNAATTVWPVNQWLLEQFSVPVSQAFALPTAARIGVVLFHHEQNENPALPVTDSNGNALGGQVIFGRVRLEAKMENRVPGWPVVQPLGDHFGKGQLTLAGMTLTPRQTAPNTPVDIVFRWQVHKRLTADYTVFLHLTDAYGKLIRTADAPPVRGDLPTTLWRPGDQLLDQHQFTLPAGLPAGRYQLWMGLYEPISGKRLTARQVNGKPWANNAVLLGRWQVNQDGTSVFRQRTEPSSGGVHQSP